MSARTEKITRKARNGGNVTFEVGMSTVGQPTTVDGKMYITISDGRVAFIPDGFRVVNGQVMAAQPKWYIRDGKVVRRDA